MIESCLINLVSIFSLHMNFHNIFIEYCNLSRQYETLTKRERDQPKKDLLLGLIFPIILGGDNS